jgi:polar amino acid transport system substrate-binding protein
MRWRLARSRAAARFASTAMCHEHRDSMRRRRPEARRRGHDLQRFEPFEEVGMTRFMQRLLLAVGAVVGCATLSNVHADQLSDVKARGVLTCGILANFEPFGYQDAATREFKGYDVDFCHGVAKALGVKPELKAISLEARIPELTQKRVDLLAAGLGYTADRAKQIGFSDAYFVSRSMVVAKDGKGFKATQDLAGKRISTVRGGTIAMFLSNALPTATQVAFDDYPAAFLAFAQDKVDGFATSEIALMRFKSKMDTQVPIILLTPALGQELWGLGVRKEEEGFRKAVNDALQTMERSGEAQRIFDKWLGSESTFKMTREFKIHPIPQ